MKHIKECRCNGGEICPDNLICTSCGNINNKRKGLIFHLPMTTASEGGPSPNLLVAEMATLMFVDKGQYGT